MTATGYFLLILICDNCRAEQVYRSSDYVHAKTLMREKGWKQDPRNRDIPNAVVCPTCYRKLTSNRDLARLRNGNMRVVE